jgi:ADP-ribosylglycohydrolase
MVGDVIGSPYEAMPAPPIDFPNFQKRSSFTDDTVMTAAVAEAFLLGIDVGTSLRAWGKRHPDAGYGGTFEGWLEGKVKDRYGSLGNGGPMRVSSAGWLAGSVGEALVLADIACLPTHFHPEAVASSRAVAEAIFRGRCGEPRSILRESCGKHLGEPIPSLDELRENPPRTVKALPTTLAALACVAETTDVESAVRTAVSLGGDADTTAAIAGSIAEAWTPVPDELWTETAKRLPDDVLAVIVAFDAAMTSGKKQVIDPESGLPVRLAFHHRFPRIIRRFLVRVRTGKESAIP